MMVTVVLWGSLKPLADGQSQVEIEASTIGELLAQLGKSYPGLKPRLQAGVSVSINGRIFRDSWLEKIPPGSEVYLLPRVSGG
jgi:molybdopterin converting factor small subunit